MHAFNFFLKKDIYLWVLIFLFSVSLVFSLGILIILQPWRMSSVFWFSKCLFCTLTHLYRWLCTFLLCLFLAFKCLCKALFIAHPSTVRPFDGIPLVAPTKPGLTQPSTYTPPWTNPLLSIGFIHLALQCPAWRVAVLQWSIQRCESSLCVSMQVSHCEHFPLTLHLPHVCAICFFSWPLTAELIPFKTVISELKILIF